MHLCEPNFPRQFNRLVEVGIGLTWKTNDYIGRDSGPVQPGFD